MKGTWHRLGLYLGLRGDRDLKAGRKGGSRDVEEAGIAVSLLALAASSVLTAFFIHLFDGDMSAGSILITAAVLFLPISISWAVSAGIKRRSNGPGASKSGSRGPR